MPRFTKATVILNAPHLQNDMQICKFTLDHVLSVINDARPPLVSTDMTYKHFRRKWGDQKIRVAYTLCRAMDGKEYALVTDVLADVPPDARHQ